MNAPIPTRWPLASAIRLAQKIVGELAPMCERIQIAGSIRRQIPLVGDIDLVVLPKPGFRPALRERITRAARVEIDGTQNLVVTLGNGMQLDTFFAHPAESDLLGETTPSNWATLLVCRTGSKEHNIKLANAALRRGVRWNPYSGIIQDGRPLTAESEEDIFVQAGLPYLPPEARD